MYGKDRIPQAWRLKLYSVIFESNTPAGRLFDVVLLWAILLSVLAVMMESVGAIREEYGMALRILELAFTIIFTVEYMLRIIAAGKPWRYIFSFYGIIDLLAILPSYIGLVVTGTHFLLVIRSIRLLRIFRVLKLSRYLGEAEVLQKALRGSLHKIGVFLSAVLIVTVIVGTLMFLIEGPESGYTSIPTSIYWAIVTLTTVGYGDIAPVSFIGQLLAAMLMITGYGVIAVPTGLVSVEYTRAIEASKKPAKTCKSCGTGGLEASSKFCQECGEAV